MNKLTLTIDLPDDFTKQEVSEWQRRITSMAAYVVKEIITDRSTKVAQSVAKSIRFSEPTNDPK